MTTYYRDFHDAAVCFCSVMASLDASLFEPVHRRTAFAQSHQSLRCSLTQYMEPEKTLDKKTDLARLVCCACTFKGSKLARRKRLFSHEPSLFAGYLPIR